MYSYYTELFDDVKVAIEDYYTADEIRANLADRDAWAERLNDDLWADDSVTGNGSGSYTFSTWKAEENLTHNWDLLEEEYPEEDEEETEEADD